MSEVDTATSRGRTWFQALSGRNGIVKGGASSVLRCDAPLGNDVARFLAVVPNPHSRFPRVRNGEVGLEEGWTLAKYVREAVEPDGHGVRRPIVAIVDVTSQAYGLTEELMGIHLACAAAVDAYATARLAGHPVVALLAGQAMSGAFLAHGYQANRILALDDPHVAVHAMGKAAAARVTKRSVSDLDALGEFVLPMSYDIHTFAKLGILDALIEVVNADAPTPADIAKVLNEVSAAVADARSGSRDLTRRLGAPARSASAEVRRRMSEQWSGVAPH